MASVEVVVNAVVEQAQQAIEDTADKIEDVGASARTAKTGLSSLDNALDSVTRSVTAARSRLGGLGRTAMEQVPGLRLLASTVDEVGDELTETAASTPFGVVFRMISDPAAPRKDRCGSLQVTIAETIRE